MNESRQRWARILAVGLVVTLVATACGSKNKSDSATKDNIDKAAPTTVAAKAQSPRSWPRISPLVRLSSTTRIRAARAVTGTVDAAVSSLRAEKRAVKWNVLP